MAKKKPMKKSTEADLVPIKMHKAMRRAIQQKADKYADGNFSAFMRHASMAYIPKRGEVIHLSTMPSSKAPVKSGKKKKH